MNQLKTKRPRIQSIDLLRGVVMILMALDHTREYFHYESFLFNPTSLNNTTIPIFFTRFITHFCAPVFVFLSGTSAYFMSKKRSKKSLSLFLIKRGMWLIILEFTLIKFAWLFRIDFQLYFLLVIWILGASMIGLALFIHFPKKLAITLAFGIILGHNIFDFVQLENIGFFNSSFWQILYSGGKLNFFLKSVKIYSVWPLLPWFALMVLGYYFGQIYNPNYNSQNRIKFLYSAGIVSILFFIIVRTTNVYGDPRLWEVQNKFSYTILSFIKVSKYPPSLLFLLITMGPSLIFLGLAEKFKGRITYMIVVFGRVPLFFYIIHLYLIHIIATVAAVLTGYQFSDMIFDFAIHRQEELKGYGFRLEIVYLIWAGIIMFLYPLCSWYNNYKNDNTDKRWLSYL